MAVVTLAPYFGLIELPEVRQYYVFLLLKGSASDRSTP